MTTFDDDDEEILKQDEYDKYLSEENIPVGDIGFKFIKIFKGY